MFKNKVRKKKLYMMEFKRDGVIALHVAIVNMKNFFYRDTRSIP